MSLFFNTTGPCRPDEHYMLPPKDRLVGAKLELYIKNKLYWVLHAPRQVGKTTFLQSWTRELNASGEVIACYVSVERCQGVPEAEKAIPAICDAINLFALKTLPESHVPPIPDTNTSPQSSLEKMMSNWAAQVAPKPLVVLFDEVDTLEGPAMVSFLRQLRSGFAEKGVGKYPVSIALVGMRDLRDYLAESKDGVSVNPGSPFNIKEDSATICNFSKEDIVNLVGQHTEETGQVFTPEALDRIWYWTSGQPWLVNALCKKIAWDLVPEETKETVTAEHIEQAKELLIQSRAVHIDSLAERLKQPSVHRVIETIFTGVGDGTIGRGDRDVDLCMDLGLVNWDDGLVIANRIYREVIPRYLSLNYQDNVPKPEFNWKTEDGGLDLPEMLKQFQRFWAWHSELWEQKADYTEAFPHLLLMAFFQRIVNGGGRIEREYACGRGRVDMMIEFGDKLHIIEIKLVHPKAGRQMTVEQGLEQLSRYSDRLNADECCLVVFDRRMEWRKKTWEERLSMETAEYGNRSITVAWC